jgi:L,D-transpeptidase YbiS
MRGGVFTVKIPRRAVITLVYAAILVLSLPVFIDFIAEESPATGDPGALAKFQEEFQRVRPKTKYLVIDTASNLLFIKKGDEIVLQAVCSTGSGLELVTPARTWQFRTPRGAFQVRSLTRNPVWRKPDWAFLEEGEPLPKRESDRFERNVLGDYALGIGEGYFIHGTLYTRLLGTNVTHGCIRLGSQDLKILAKTIPLGTKVYIF